ncbi:MAG: type III-A CRISPR-associated RAMP protein Csm3 [Pseudomonadota bacterium]|nr:type III-A CRISPR-associated RAMP protein Csm3 [Pseudomonadota bacterium]
MKLTNIQRLSGRIELLSGLHIGSGNTEMHIGGTDNPVIKNPITQYPYIPGSSIKGKMRSLLEWELGVVGLTDGAPLSFKHMKGIGLEELDVAKTILKLFGGAPTPDCDEALVREIGPSRLSFWDCNPDPAWIGEMDGKHLLLTETKMENSIDRIKGVAENPRNTERVPAGARFEFQLSIRVHDDEDLGDNLFKGLKLLEIAGLGGSGSRGYGKLRFRDLKLDEQDVQARLDDYRLSQVA